MKSLLALLSALLLAACAPPAPQPGASTQPAAPVVPAAVKYNTAIPVKDVMLHVVDRGADLFWTGAGESYSKGKPVVDLSPKTQADWDRVISGAATVVVATNSLKLPGYARAPVADWDRHAEQIAEIATRGKAAAERKDKTAMYDIGAELDDACENCHKQFDPNYLKK